PIDLSRLLQIQYASTTPKAVVNNGAQIQAQFNASAADTITLDGQTYQLKQFHFHDPSENHVAGNAFPMEVHFVNQSALGAETVVAASTQPGPPKASPQPILDAATQHLPSPNTTTTTGPIDFSGLLPKDMPGWFYEGSLTTPPLSQAVNW